MGQEITPYLGWGTKVRSTRRVPNSSEKRGDTVARGGTRRTESRTDQGETALAGTRRTGTDPLVVPRQAKPAGQQGRERRRAGGAG